MSRATKAPIPRNLNIGDILRYSFRATLIGLAAIAVSRSVPDVSAEQLARINLALGPLSSLQQEGNRSQANLLFGRENPPAPLLPPAPNVRDKVEVLSSNSEEKEEIELLYSHSMCDEELKDIVVYVADKFPLSGNRSPSNPDMFALGKTEDHRDEKGSIEVTLLSRQAVRDYYDFLLDGDSLGYGVATTEFAAVYLEDPEGVSLLRAEEAGAHEMAHACGEKETDVTSRQEELRKKLDLSPMTSRIANRITQHGFKFSLRTIYGDVNTFEGMEELLPETIGRLRMMEINPDLAKKLIPTLRYMVTPYDELMGVPLDQHDLIEKLRGVQDRGSLDELVEFSENEIIQRARERGEEISRNDAKEKAWERLGEAVNSPNNISVAGSR